jgi:hypothetical protein
MHCSNLAQEAGVALPQQRLQTVHGGEMTAGPKQRRRGAFMLRSIRPRRPLGRCYNSRLPEKFFSASRRRLAMVTAARPQHSHEETMHHE